MLTIVPVRPLPERQWTTMTFIGFSLSHSICESIGQRGGCRTGRDTYAVGAKCLGEVVRRALKLVKEELGYVAVKDSRVILPLRAQIVHSIVAAVLRIKEPIV